MFRRDVVTNQKFMPSPQKTALTVDDVTRLKYPWPNVGIRESATSQVPVHADFDRDRRLAPAGQWRGSYPDLAGAERSRARRRRQLPDPGRISIAGGHDLSGVAGGLAGPARDRLQNR